jgi:hypothetical protein
MIFSSIARLLKAAIGNGATGAQFTITGGAHAGVYVLTPTGEHLGPYMQLAEQLHTASAGIGDSSGFSPAIPGPAVTEPEPA